MVPSLGVRDGMSSAAVELFVERARSVNGGFGWHNDADAAAFNEICARLDGIALSGGHGAVSGAHVRPFCAVGVRHEYCRLGQAGT